MPGKKMERPRTQEILPSAEKVHQELATAKSKGPEVECTITE